MDRPGSRRSMWSPPWLIVLAAASLGACQGLSQEASWAGERSEPQAPSWRVVERVGESRYLSPSMSGWEQVVAGSILPAGSQISTGIGGRLILTQASNQMSAGTSSRFILPGWEPGAGVRQTAGWLRYRIAGAQAGGFAIETPFLDLSMGDAVVDVTVAERETEVAVVSGRVHVKTLDDRRQIDLHAGYVGYASLDGSPLALRRGPGLALEPVPATVIPALHPGRPDQAATTHESVDMLPRPESLTTATLPAMAGSSMAAQLGEPGLAAHATGASEDPTTGVGGPVATVLPASMAKPVATAISIDGAGPDIALGGTPATGAPDPTGEAPEAETLVRSAKALPQAAAPPAEMPIPESADQVRHRFDLLTEGLLDGLSPAPPAMPGNRR